MALVGMFWKTTEWTFLWFEMWEIKDALKMAEGCLPESVILVKLKR